MSQNELDQLEEFVGNLLERYKNLRKEHSETEKLLAQREGELALLQENLRTTENEKSAAGERVRGLIRQIEEWEALLDEEKNDTGADAGASPEGNDSGAEDGYQQNLFHAP